MNLSKLAVACAAAAGMLGAASMAQASIVFSFDPTGSGSTAINGATLLDQAPGSSIALNGVEGGGPLTVGTVISTLYQSNLNAVLGPSSVIKFSNGGGGSYFTFVAGFDERVIASSNSGGVVNNTFEVLSGGFFKMCLQGALGNNLAGTGFSCAGNGILSGTVTGGNATQTGYPQRPLQDLDQAVSDDWSNTQTVTSNGAADLSLTINYVDSGYFPDLQSGLDLVLAFVNSSNVTPFREVDPSRRFSSDGIADGDHVADVGETNGITGPDFLFQADANSSFERQAVPEPGTLALAGIALGAAGLVSRRRRKN